MKEKEEKKKVTAEKAAKKQFVKEYTLTEQAVKKKLREMNLLDDFLFGSVVTYPEIGERFVKILLKMIFGRAFRKLSVTAQKVFYGADTDLHGARLDVYMEPEKEYPEERAAVYDMEPDQNDTASDKRALPRRVRFYHGKIMARSLNAGTGYDELKNVVIIMIMPYDPFGLNRMVYTVKNHCVEEPGMEYDDGGSTLFLYTKGTKGVPNETLRQLLHYMEDTVCENAVNDDLKEVHKMVELVKYDPETSLSLLRLEERLNRSKKEGKAEGKTEKLVTQVCKKMRLGQPIEKIAEDLVEDISVIGPIYSAAEKFAPEYAPESVLERLAAGEW